MPIDAEWDSLDSWLAGEEAPPRDEPSAEPDEPPQLNGQDEANAAMRRLARLERARHDVAEVAAAEMDRVRRWLTDRIAGIENQQAWVDASLESYMRAHFDATGTVTLDLPNGTLRLRPVPSKVIVASGPGVELLQNEHPELVKIDVNVIKDAVKKSAEPGDRISDETIDLLKLDVPDGYEARFAKTPDGDNLPGVFFVTRDDRAFSRQVRG